MSVGLPGAGIGGIFYIGSALWMPFASIGRALRQRTRARVSLAARQALIALGIIAALYVTGWTLAHFIGWMGSLTAVAHTAGAAAGGSAALPKFFRAATFAITFGTLALVLLSVQVLRFFYAAPTAPAPTIDDERQAA